jgi:hypothetical protein
MLPPSARLPLEASKRQLRVALDLSRVWTARPLDANEQTFTSKTPNKRGSAGLIPYCRLPGNAIALREPVKPAGEKPQCRIV